MVAETPDADAGAKGPGAERAGSLRSYEWK